MKIIICGAGQVGYNIAQQLAREDNEIVLIDQNETLIAEINQSLDVRAIAGHASHPSVLEAAGAAEADMLIAVTFSDEVNMVACHVARFLFNVPTTIARVRHQDYLLPQWKELFQQQHIPIDVIISPEAAVGTAILRRLHAPGALDMIPFADDRLRVLAVRCEPNAPLINLPLSLARNRMEGLPMRILGVIRDERFLIAAPNLIIGPEDVVYFCCATEATRPALALFGHAEREAHRLIILGGGNVGLHIAHALEEEGHALRVKLIEIFKERAEDIAEQLKETVVIHGNAMDRNILLECGIENTETILAVTNDDKVNILASLLAKRCGCRRAITLVNNNTYIPLLSRLGIDVVVNPRESTISSILQHIRRGKIRSVHSVHGGIAEIISAEAVATSPLIGKQLGQAGLPRGVVIGAILRDGNVIIPEADDVIYEHDLVVLLSLAEAIKKMERFFSVSLEFF